MVTRPFTQGLSWLHARVGRVVPLARIPESQRRTTNPHARVKPLSRPSLQATGYLFPKNSL
jgi:hypothetical protein